MTVIYFEDGAKIIEPDHQNRRADLERWLDDGSQGRFGTLDHLFVSYRVNLGGEQGERALPHLEGEEGLRAPLTTVFVPVMFARRLKGKDAA